MAGESANSWSAGSAPLYGHSWNKEHTQVAVCPSGCDVIILQRSWPSSAEQSAQWSTVCKLQKHEGQVSAVDWAPNADRIVSGSYDGNAYVWEKLSGQVEQRVRPQALAGPPCPWGCIAVKLQSSRALLCAAWSPKENKFAVGSGARTVSVCSFDPVNEWWTGRAIRKKHDSSVTGVAWHPNNVLVATTSTDFKCRIFSAYIKEVDPKVNADDAGAGFPSTKFGEQMVELDLAKCWAFGVAFSPSGMNLAFTGHDCSIHFINNIGPHLSYHSVYLDGLPLRDVLCPGTGRQFCANEKGSSSSSPGGGH